MQVHRLLHILSHFPCGDFPEVLNSGGLVKTFSYPNTNTWVSKTIPRGHCCIAMCC